MQQLLLLRGGGFSVFLVLCFCASVSRADDGIASTIVNGYSPLKIGMDCLGSDVITPSKAEDVSSCAAMCNLFDSCTGFVFYVQSFSGVYNTTRIEREAGSCSLKDRTCKFVEFSHYTGPSAYLKRSSSGSTTSAASGALPSSLMVAVAASASLAVFGFRPKE